MKGAKAEDKKSSKRKAATSLTEKQMKRKVGKEKRLKKDPNKPKRPPSPFFVFLTDFRKQYMKDHPNTKAVSEVGKAAGAKWKTMSTADKAPYVSKAEKLKSDYEKQMLAYNKKKDDGDAEGPASAEEESEKSKSEVNDDDEGSEEED